MRVCCLPLSCFQQSPNSCRSQWIISLPLHYTTKYILLVGSWTSWIFCISHPWRASISGYLCHIMTCVSVITMSWEWCLSLTLSLTRLSQLWITMAGHAFTSTPQSMLESILPWECCPIISMPLTPTMPQHLWITIQWMILLLLQHTIQSAPWGFRFGLLWPDTGTSTNYWVPLQSLYCHESVLSPIIMLSTKSQQL